MNSRIVIVKLFSGMNQRSATIFADTAVKFKSIIRVKHNGVQANGKSFLGLLSRNVRVDDVIEIIADGPDENEALDTLENLVKSNFQEY